MMTLDIVVAKLYIFGSLKHIHQFYWWIHCKTVEYKLTLYMYM